MMLRGGALPPEPAIVAANPLDIEIVFVNSLARAQMIEDVKLGLCGKGEVRFYGRTGGMVPSYDEIINETEKLVKGV